MQDLDTIYKLIDSKTGNQIGKDYTWANRNRARNKADRMNLEYGAHRYSASPVFKR